jgi:hypothetical protein
MRTPGFTGAASLSQSRERYSMALGTGPNGGSKGCDCRYAVCDATTHRKTCTCCYNGVCGPRSIACQHVCTRWECKAGYWS